ncbi:MAG: cytochrome c [Bacteroidota bacterium]
MKKILLIILSILILGVTALLSFVSLGLPNVGPPEEISIEITPQRVERGTYLAHHVTICMDCHSTRDWSKFSGPLVEGTLGKGGEEFNQTMGFPGSFTAKNLTPTNLGDWTDGELLRAIASGVNKAGDALFPVMPHPNYGQMDREDLYSIIAYLRTLEPIENEVAESNPDFPMTLILNTIPQAPQFSSIPDKTDKVAYGKYLFTASSCADCHTQQIQGAPLEGMELAGGFKFPMPSGTVWSANITPDKGTGIGTWTEEMFVQRFKAYADSSYTPADVQQGDFNTVMPWLMYAGMEEADLQAIYAYLQTVKPINNKLVRFQPHEAVAASE